MDLIDYLTAMDGADQRVPVPDRLALPDRFVNELAKLAILSESKGLEHGCALLYDPRSRTLGYGKVVAGEPTSMNIPVSTDPNNFGNLHAHPSASIGHGGGHSAHSMQDLLKFADTQDRRYFIQFVASGPRNYAMVQVKGISTWDGTVRSFLGKRQGSEEEAMWGAIFQAAGGVEAYDALRDPLGTDTAAVMALFTRLKTQAGMGKLMQTLSTENCAAFAKTFHYYFYAGEDGFLTKVG